MASRHLDDLLTLLEVWKPGKLPSELVTYYAPDVARRWHVTPADWYAFDLAATARWSELQRDREGQQAAELAGQGGASPQRAAPSQMRAQMRPGTVSENGGDFAIRGNEIPPWDPRYRAAKPARSAAS